MYFVITKFSSSLIKPLEKFTPREYVGVTGCDVEYILSSILTLGDALNAST